MARFVAVGLALLLSSGCQHAESPMSTPTTPASATPPPASAATTGTASDAGGPPARALAPGSWGLIPGPARPLDELLGRTKADVEAELRRSAESDADGWVRYGETWALRYEGGCAVELRSELPEGVDCPQAAILTGYADCPSATRNGRICVWPGRFLSAEFDPDSRTFWVRLLREGRSCAPPGVK